MTKREKIINGLECCNNDDCDNCSYFRSCNEDDLGTCRATLYRDILVILKAQEPVEPKWRKGYAYCGQCEYKLHWIVDLNNFCPNCGRAVKWNET